MSNKVKKALIKLRDILPLQENQQQLSVQHKKLHQQVLHSFVNKGRILNRDEMAQYVDNLEKAIDILNTNDMVTFSDKGEPIGAYPFTMNEREHKIQVNGYQVNAMCALDALSIAPMFDENTNIISQCRVTGDPVNIKMSGENIKNYEQVKNIHFGIFWGAADEQSYCADSLCMEMIFLRDSEIAQQWLDDNSQGKEVFTLLEAVEFACKFFVPLLKN